MLDPYTTKSPPPEATPRPPETAAPPTPSDLLLIDKARVQDLQAWQLLMRRYNQRLFRIARSLLPNPEACADRVEDAYVHASRDLPRYDPGGKVSSWLAQLLLGEILNAKNEQIRTTLREATSGAAVAQADKLRKKPVVRPDTEARMLEKLIDEVPAAFRTVLVLRLLETVSGSEIALSLGINETTVRTRLHRALRRLPPNIAPRIGLAGPEIYKLEPLLSERIIKRVSARIQEQ